MHEAAVEEVVGRGGRVGFVEAPAWFAFRVGFDDREREVVLEVLDMAYEIGAVGEGAEEAWEFISKSWDVLVW